eukprot:ANDGO_03065.mRNA.1 hypothetical protein
MLVFQNAVASRSPTVCELLVLESQSWSIPFKKIGNTFFISDTDDDGVFLKRLWNSSAIASGSDLHRMLMTKAHVHLNLSLSEAPISVFNDSHWNGLLSSGPSSAISFADEIAANHSFTVVTAFSQTCSICLEHLPHIIQASTFFPSHVCSIAIDVLRNDQIRTLLKVIEYPSVYFLLDGTLKTAYSDALATAPLVRAVCDFAVHVPGVALEHMSNLSSTELEAQKRQLVELDIIREGDTVFMVFAVLGLVFNVLYKFIPYVRAKLKRE